MFRTRGVSGLVAPVPAIWSSKWIGPGVERSLDAARTSARVTTGWIPELEKTPVSSTAMTVLVLDRGSFPIYYRAHRFSEGRINGYGSDLTSTVRLQGLQISCISPGTKRTNL